MTGLTPGISLELFSRANFLFRVSEIRITGFTLAIAFLFLAINGEGTVNEECRNWFRKLKIDAGDPRDCVKKCITAPTGMATFDCPPFCDEMCNRSVEKREEPYQAPNPVPDLCPDEVYLIVENPENFSRVHYSRKRALELTRESFGLSSILNDESDAFRHFVWAGLLAMETSPEYAKAFTDSHESCTFSDAAQEMDYSNNAAAIGWVEKMKKKGSISEKALLAEAKRLLRERKLVVLRQRLEKDKQK